MVVNIIIPFIGLVIAFFVGGIIFSIALHGIPHLYKHASTYVALLALAVVTCGIDHYYGPTSEYQREIAKLKAVEIYPEATQHLAQLDAEQIKHVSVALNSVKEGYGITRSDLFRMTDNTLAVRGLAYLAAEQNNKLNPSKPEYNLELIKEAKNLLGITEFY